MNMRVRPKQYGWVPWEPVPATKLVIDQVRSILSDQSDYLPLSIRQIFYLGVSAHGWTKTDKFYRHLCNYLTRARRAGLIPFDQIRDDTMVEECAHSWSSVDSYHATVRHMAESFVLDPMLDQPRDVVVWMEGKGLVPMIRRFVDPYHVRVMTSGGFDSLTAKYDLANRYADRDAVVLHFGDMDPSGEKMFDALRNDVRAFGGRVEFQRIAVTREQVIDLDLPTAPVKGKGHAHEAGFDGDETVQLEAIRPDDLQRIVTGAVTDALDMDAFAASMERSAAIREGLMS